MSICVRILTYLSHLNAGSRENNSGKFTILPVSVVVSIFFQLSHTGIVHNLTPFMLAHESRLFVVVVVVSAFRQNVLKQQYDTANNQAIADRSECAILFA